MQKDDIVDFLVHLKEQGCKPTTVSFYGIGLRRFDIWMDVKRWHGVLD